MWFFGSSLSRVGDAKKVKKHKHLEISSDSFGADSLFIESASRIIALFIRSKIA
jgi:hypothetical protein